MMIAADESSLSLSPVGVRAIQENSITEQKLRSKSILAFEKKNYCIIKKVWPLNLLRLCK